MSDPRHDETDNADDTFGWTDDPGDPDAGGAPAEFVDTPDAAPEEATDPSGA